MLNNNTIKKLAAFSSSCNAFTFNNCRSISNAFPIGEIPSVLKFDRSYCKYPFYHLVFKESSSLSNGMRLVSEFWPSEIATL